jgi:RHS repeat-associated protein
MPGTQLSPISSIRLAFINLLRRFGTKRVAIALAGAIFFSVLVLIALMMSLLVQREEVYDLSEVQRTPEFATSVITADTGGTLTTKSGEVAVEFPAGFLTEDVQINYREVRDVYATQNRVGPVFELTAWNGEGEEISQFLKPVTIKTTLADATQTSAALYFYNLTTGKWEKLESSVVDGEVVAYSTHFTTFTTASEDPNSGEAASSGAIVDDSDPAPAFVPGSNNSGQPSWWGTLGTGYNNNATYTGNSVNSTPHNWATWTATDINGEIEVFATIPNGPYIYDVQDAFYGRILPLTQSAKYVITHAGGTSEVTVNQAAAEGGSVSLGTYTFDGTGSVYLSDVVGESGQVLLSAIAFDAISFGEDLGNLDLVPPTIEDVKVHTDNGRLVIQACISDVGSGVADAFVFFNGQAYPMQASDGCIYSVALPYGLGANLTYYIIAHDVAGNESIYQPGRGYVTRGAFIRNNGFPAWYRTSKGSKYLTNGNVVCDPVCEPMDGGDPYIGDPINSVTGNLVDRTKLVLIPGVPTLDLHLTYNSQGAGLGVFGENWTHSYNYHLLEMDNVDFKGAFVQYPDGRAVRFSGNNFTPDAGNFEKLTKTGDGYELKFTDLSKVKFDADGDITRWEDANGNGINFTYGEKVKYTLFSQIKSMKTDAGREITLEYNADGLVSKVNAPEGKILSFEYDGNDDLVTLTNANGGVTAFTYSDHNITQKVSPVGHNFFVNSFDGQHRVISQTAGISFTNTFSYSDTGTSITDANGNVITYRRNSDYLVTEVVDAESKSLKFEYNPNKQVTVEVDRDGARTEYQYDSNGNQTLVKDALGQFTSRIFDANNRLTQEIDKQGDHITTFTYDSKGNLLTITDANASIASRSYDAQGRLTSETDFNGNTTTYEYNVHGNVTAIHDAAGNTQLFGYEGLGRVVSMVNARGVAFSYQYDGNDNLLTLNGPLGYTQSYSYNANDKLIKETDPKGGSITYTYNASDMLVQTENQLGFVTSYTYGLMNKRLTETDPEGRVTNFNYDPTYTLTNVVEAVGTGEAATTAMVYDNMRQLTETIDAEGRVTKYTLDSLGRVTKEVRNANANPQDSENNVTTSFSYSVNDKVVQQVDANGKITTYTYDTLDRLVKLQDAQGQTTTYEYDKQSNLTKQTNPRGFVTTYEYDALNRLVRIIDAKGGASVFAYDPEGNISSMTDTNGVVTKYNYDELDRMQAKVENFIAGIGSDASTNVTNTYGYDLNGNVISITNGRGFTTQFNHDAADRNTVIIDATGNTVTMSYDKVDNLLAISDQKGHTTSYSYDSLDRVIKSTNPEGHFDSYSYDKVGNVVKEINARGKERSFQIDPLNRVKVVTNTYSKTQVHKYDAMGNLLQLTDENGNSTRFNYDNVYRLTTQTDAENFSTRYEYDANGNIVKLIDGNNNSTLFGYDELDRLVTKQDAEVQVENFSYDGLENVTQEVEADGTVHKYVYDPLYRLVQVLDNFRSGQPATSDTNVMTNYRYDANGNIISSIDPLNHATNFAYDALDRMVEETNALNNKWLYGYDPAGNLATRIDANGAVTDYSYYADDQLQMIDYPSHDVKYQYNETNFPVEMMDNLGKTSWSYDDLDRLIDQQDPLNRKLSYQYDHVGNLTKLTYPDNRNVAHTYLKNNWLRNSKTSDQDSVTFTRDGVGMPTRLDRGNSSFSTINYDKVYRPTAVLDQQVDSGNHLITKYNYTYNKVGDITKERAEYGWRKPGVVNSEFSYDGVHRLSKSTSDDGQSSTYAYDAAGNRTSLVEKLKKGPETRTYKYNEINQLLSIDIASPMPPNVVKHTYKYDKNGNRIDKLISDGTGVDRGVRYAYDAENRLLQAQDYKGQITATGSGTVNDLAHTDMQYDGNGRRLVKTYYSGASQPGKRNEYTYDRSDPVVQHSMWNGQRQNLYRDSGQNLMLFQDFKSEQAPNGTAYWYSFDGRGNIVAATKHKAQSDHSYRYDEYGSVIPETGNWTAPHNEYTMSQKEFDGNTGLYYFGARYYDAEIGTWISQDSYRGEIENPASLARYMYNYDSPINYVDYYGYSPSEAELQKQLDTLRQNPTTIGPATTKNDNTITDWEKATLFLNEYQSLEMIQAATLSSPDNSLDAGVGVFSDVMTEARKNQIQSDLHTVVIENPSWDANKYASNYEAKEALIRRGRIQMWFPGNNLFYAYTFREDKYQSLSREDYMRYIIMPRIEAGLIDSYLRVRDAHLYEQCMLQPAPGPAPAARR